MASTLRPRGAFSLAAAAGFAESFPATEVNRSGAELRFAWPVDDDWRTAEATVRQRGDAVQVELTGSLPADLARAARRDVERILCLDVDGTGFAALDEHDAVVGELKRRFGDLRPVLFFTPYEAAAWAIIGHRIRITQAATVERRLAADLGEHNAFPAPERLATLAAPRRGLSDRKVDQLRTLGRAAIDGQLSRERLRAMTFDDAIGDLQRLPGIGPFSAELIVIRGVGAPDALPRHERRLERAARAAYDLADGTDLEPITERWRPYRSWVALLLRAWFEAETLDIAPARGPARRSSQG